MRVLAAVAVLLLLACTAIAQDPAPTKEAPAYTMPALGEFWYGMYTPDGKPEGYARIEFAKTAQGGLHCDWELHIAYEGGSYEETRAISFDANWRLTYSEFESGENRTLAAREGNVMVGKQNIDDLRVEVAEDAVTGMAFILAACAELKEGSSFARTEYNEAAGLTEQGSTSFSVGKAEDVETQAGKFSAFNVTMQRSEKARGRKLPVWVNSDRKIVQVDWGTSNLMKLHNESTKDLFKPQPAAVTDLDPDNANLLTVGGDFPGFTAEEMWAHWTTPEGMTKWWAPASEMEIKVGGKYTLMWKDEAGNPTWTLLGKVVAFETNKQLTFSWKWEQMPEEELEVSVTITPIEGGVSLKITHGRYKDAEHKKASGHLEGWQYFCTKLRNLKQ